jgi:anti-sigma factor RsiW
VSCDVTYEELAAFVTGDLPEERQRELGAHLPACGRCRRRVAALRQADAALGALRPPQPSPDALLAARRAVSRQTRPTEPGEVMTLDDVAEFLRIEPDDLADVIDELPAFEVAGKVRVRRTRLVEWIRTRERDYARDAAASWAARIAAGDGGTGAKS